MLRRYDNPIDTKPSDSIYLRDVCQFLAVGEYTRPIVNRPPLPSSLDERLLVAIPRNKRKNVKNILWILFHSIDEMKYFFFNICLEKQTDLYYLDSFKQ